MKSNPFLRGILFARKINYTIIFCAFIICFFGCRKTNDAVPSNSNPATISEGSMAITTIGTPVGQPVSKIIGAAGGTIVSGDGVVEVHIPAGALSSDVNISIQPMTNEAPGGIGYTYDLLPNGTRFSTPATLSFHYSDDSLMGSAPELLWILVQDSANAWEADQEVQDLDTVAKKLNAGISHFSRRSISKSLVISDTKEFLRNGEQSVITVNQITTTNGGPSGPVTVFGSVPDYKVSNWQVLGIDHPGEPLGNIAGKGHQVTYNAPQQIIENNSLEVTADVGPIIEWNGGSKSVRPVVTVHVPLYLLNNEFNYSVYFSFKDPQVTGYVGQLYTDSAYFDMKIVIGFDPTHLQEIATATLSNILNYGPSVVPGTETYNKPDGSRVSYTWIPDPVGVYNINTVSIEDSVLDDDSLVLFNFLSDKGTTPGFSGHDVPEDGGVNFTVPSINLPAGFVASTIGFFKINRKEQAMGDPAKGYYFKFTPKTP